MKLATRKVVLLITYSSVFRWETAGWLWVGLGRGGFAAVSRLQSLASTQGWNPCPSGCPLDPGRLHCVQLQALVEPKTEHILSAQWPGNVTSRKKTKTNLARKVGWRDEARRLGDPPGNFPYTCPNRGGDKSGGISPWLRGRTHLPWSPLFSSGRRSVAGLWVFARALRMSPEKS